MRLNALLTPIIGLLLQVVEIILVEFEIRIFHSIHNVVR